MGCDLRNYEHKITNLKPGYQACFFKRNFFAFWIRKVTDSDCTHVGTVYGVKAGKLQIAEALGDGYILKEYSQKKVTKLVKSGKLMFRSIELDPNKVRKSIDKRIGTKYGRLQILWIFIKEAFRKDVKSDGNKTLICSEANAIIIFEASNETKDVRKEFGIRDFDDVYPLHIYSTRLATDLYITGNSPDKQEE